ncbi:hypothetical protein KKB40_01190 [Patescibacteria group bacterium]|nr:hypothetical protein [Patescibacteria group bacterium]
MVKKSEKYIPISATSDVGVKVEGLEKESKFIKTLMTAVIIVFFISFLTFVIDAFLYRTDAYREFTQIVESNRKFIKEETAERETIVKDIEEIKKVLKLE